MIVTTEAIILQIKPFAEQDALVSVFSASDGKVKALARRQRKQAAALQPGNIGHMTWRRRLEHQLGTLTWENSHAITALAFQDACHLQAVRYVTDILEAALPEGHAYAAFYEKTAHFLQTLAAPHLPERLALFELNLLTTIGYGLSLKPETAVPCTSGTPLMYVSPNTGRAVTQAMGEPYADKLLPLPALFGGAYTAGQDTENALHLTGFFLQRALQSRTLVQREQLVASLNMKDVG